VKHRFISPHIKSQQMSEVTKICQRCEERYTIPIGQKKTRLSDKIIRFYPCPHCGYPDDIENEGNNNLNKDKMGRCRMCSVPFYIIDHHAKGLCARDYIKELRYKKRQ